jgi:Putative transposase, YhgA-like
MICRPRDEAGDGAVLLMSREASLLHDFPDRAIRHLLEHRQLLAELVAAVAPELAEGFDFERAELLRRDFLMEDWRRRESDLLFRVPFRQPDDAESALICVLIEHQSTPDSRMPLRLLVYSALYWEREWKAWEQEHPPGQKLRLHPIVPIVFHTGSTTWQFDRNMVELFEGPELFRRFAPDWPVLFWDLAAHPLKELKSATSDLLRVLSCEPSGKTLRLSRVFSRMSFEV